MDLDLLLMSAQWKFVWKTLLREARAHTRIHKHAMRMQWLSQRVQTHNCQWWTSWCGDFLKWQNGPGFRCRPLSDCFCIFCVFGCAQMFTGKSQYFYCWYFYTMSVWIVWLGKLTGLMVAVIRKVMFCSNKHAARQLKEKVKSNSLVAHTCQHMKVI